jgi:NDP-sugar pyrophosphorylase family protein
VLDQFEHAGIDSLLVAARADDMALREYLTQQTFFHEIRYIDTIDSTGTGGAVRLLLNEVNDRECIISTIDTIAPTKMTRQLISYAHKAPADVKCVVVASTLIDDSDPLWIDVQSDNIVTGFGKDIRPTVRVFGNVRWFAHDAVAAVNEINIPESSYRDSLIMKELVKRRPGSIRAFQYDPVFDIDDEGDIRAAEEWLRK